MKLKEFLSVLDDADIATAGTVFFGAGRDGEGPGCPIARAAVKRGFDYASQPDMRVQIREAICRMFNLSYYDTICFTAEWDEPSIHIDTRAERFKNALEAVGE